MSSKKRTAICVYCGSRSGKDARFSEMALKVGLEMAAQDVNLVYGGGRVGLMGIVADTVLSKGKEVVGVIPRNLFQKEVAHQGVTELVEVDSMNQRKAIMEERSDAFLVLPGGFGTMDEFFEILTWKQINIHQKPIGVLNALGYYDHLIAFMKKAVQEGFAAENDFTNLVISEDPKHLISELKRKTKEL
jgi:uncharacterized protein (TIGR00730 family)